MARQNGLQNSPDKTATIKSLYKELPPFLAWGHTPNCQIKITRMDETDNNWTISYQHLSVYMIPAVTPAKSVARKNNFEILLLKCCDKHIFNFLFPDFF